jgi:hypothetical protein
MAWIARQLAHEKWQVHGRQPERHTGNRHWLIRAIFQAIHGVEAADFKVIRLDDHATFLGTFHLGSLGTVKSVGGKRENEIGTRFRVLWQVQYGYWSLISCISISLRFVSHQRFDLPTSHCPNCSVVGLDKPPIFVWV